MIIDGSAIAQKIEEQIRTAVSHLPDRKPALAFVRVGDHPSSLIYIRMKKKKCAEVGIRSIDIELPATISEETLLGEIDRLNQNPLVDGILVQLPLPTHLSPQRVIERVDPTKDVDGFHPLNMGKLLIGEPDGFIPCTPYGILILLAHANIDPAGQHVVIVGRSTIVGKPLGALLLQKQAGRNATVTIAHSQTRHLSEICQTADILVAAIGSPQFIQSSMVKQGAVVIDVGINRKGETLVGDVDFSSVAPKCKAITPVPRGVGPMTIAMLLSNTLLAFQRRTGL